jgi:hypothetical protein
LVEILLDDTETRATPDQRTVGQVRVKLNRAA